MAKFYEIAILIVVLKTHPSYVKGYNWFHSDAEFAEAFSYFKDITASGCSPWVGNLVIAVKSKATQFGHRDNLRQTWLKDAESLDIPYFFVLGDPKDTEAMERIITESRQHQDLIVGTFGEYYYNLTLKGLLTFSWIKTNCAHRWLLSADDDTLVDIVKIIGLVDKLSATDGHESTAYCHVFHLLEPSRTSDSNQMIPIHAYPQKFYPDFCNGPAILYPPKVISKLLSAAIDPRTVPKMRFDDLFFTGIARKFANCSVSPELRTVNGFNKQPWQVSQLLKKNMAVHGLGQDFRRAYQMFKMSSLPMA